MNESGSAAGRPQEFGTNVAHPAGAHPVAGERGRISANSFRLLTAKLKGLKTDEILLPDVAGDVRAAHPAPAQLIAGEAPAPGEEMALPAIADADGSAAMEAETTAPEAPPPVELGRIALPEFTPLNWLPPAHEAASAADEALPAAEEEPADHAAAEPVEAFAEPAVEHEEPEDVPALAAAAGDVIEQVAGSDGPDVLPVEEIVEATGISGDLWATEPPEAADADVAVETCDIADVAVAEDPDATPEPVFAADDTVPLISEPEAIEPEPAELELAEPEAIEPVAIEPEAVEPEAIQPEAVEPEAVEPEAVEPEAVEPEAIEPEAIELEAFAAEPEPAFEPVPDVVQAEPPLEPEAVTVVAEAILEEPAPSAEPQSELAGRVVDAMLKTISTAIYAKPTASERAAFLRDMAALVEQESAAAGDEPGPAPVPSPAPAIHAVTDDLAAELPAPSSPGEEIGSMLAGRLGPASSLLKSRAEPADPFAEPPKPALLNEPILTETAEADEETGELALSLLDMMSGGAGSALPQERTLAADTLLRILPRIPVKQLLAVVERIAIMEAPPPLLVAKLIRDPRPEVVGPLLERCSHISDQDLMNAAPTGDASKLRMMARRRSLSQVLSDYLISSGEPNVLLTLIRNPGAALSHDAYYRLAEHATQHHALLAPLTTRADLPPPVAFELFWSVPTELRRFIFSRFLTDSEVLKKILRITMATHGGEGDLAQGEPKFPPRESIDGAIEAAVLFRLDEAAQQLAEIASVGKETALRILSDREGEPVAVLLKALGYPRTRFPDVLEKLRQPDAGLLRPDRKADDLQSVFDSLSFNKARILLTYWDWFVRKAGPYAPHN